jgi:nucleoside-triphosphatase THEP1
MKIMKNLVNIKIFNSVSATDSIRKMKSKVGDMEIEMNKLKEKLDSIISIDRELISNLN